jgi:hypothetical protein
MIDPTSRQKGHPTETRQQLSDINFQNGSNIWSQVPEWARYQDIMTDWPSVVTWLWLCRAASGFSSITRTRNKWRPACIEEQEVTTSPLEPADSENVHTTAARTTQPTTESSQLRGASRLQERSHYSRGRSYVRLAGFIAASAAHPNRYENARFQG